ncbi:cache domain-containing protein [Pseudoduganella violacea]|uniref:Signal transduction histidine kinase n=1 Tax=Pseudoduganella violacea TaxID=1715466 RepID=A0A7W5BC07_9BURK|nr:cache domain-containing protein [Pseudoduganella violacea]MBB3120387.1 signal transduction histidine kinase [Pseudoduganella violacea]
MKYAILAVAFIGAAVQANAAETYASRQQAEQLVGKVTAAMRKDAGSTLSAITAKDAAWVHGDLYPVVYDMQGKVLAHGQNSKLVGKNLIDIRDVEGNYYVRERVELAKSKGKFWQNYVFVDPVTKGVLPKEMYCEKLDESVVCAGVYKR